MKKILILLGISGLLLAACKKDNKTYFTESGSLTVTNKVIGGKALTFNTTTYTIGTDAYQTMPIKAGDQQVKLYDAANKTAAPYFNEKMQIENAGRYSLFLAGASPANIDAIQIKDNYTAYTDSLCGVRFINLSPNSPKLSVNVTGAANGSTVTGIAYKEYSDFVKFPAKRANSSYSFEIRNAATGEVIRSYDIST
ncbi:MAG: DUF4397 domain-containing protein, partial [Mucilaginibacter sp.]|uniref:DUF4397 domain-containing protein n=1 Tax=Mucilaginibacter sp. TaxID=1882438 RepID=UPI0031A37258